MRKFLLYSSALVAGGLLNGVAEAACIQTPTCSSLGYTSSSSCEGGIKCPFGNAWNCTAPNKITELEKILEELKVQISTSNCKVGDILYSDMTCGENTYPDKTAIGVVFDAAKGLAVALDSYPSMWGFVDVDVPSLPNYNTYEDALSDWNGFSNTKNAYEYAKSAQFMAPAFEIALAHSTKGTVRGQWYLPARGELKALGSNLDTIKSTLKKVGSDSRANFDVSSTENNSSQFWSSVEAKRKWIASTGFSYFSPIINYTSQEKIKVSECMFGDILYSDKTCSKNKINGKTPIGIVFDGTRKRAIALRSIDSSRSSFSLSRNISTASDIDGKKNTQEFLAYNIPFINAAHNYSTEGTKVGDWYIPAMGEWYVINYSYFFLNERLKEVNGEEFVHLSDYWSSTAGNNTVYYISIGFGYLDNSYNKSHKVRPALAF